MDDDEEFDINDGDPDVVILPARPLSPLDFLAFGLWAGARVADTTETILDEFSDLIAMHIGYNHGRRQLAEQAALEIEQMTGGE